MNTKRGAAVPRVLLSEALADLREGVLANVTPGCPPEVTVHTPHCPVDSDHALHSTLLAVHGPHSTLSTVHLFLTAGQEGHLRS